MLGQRISGFSLIELVVVLTIFSIMIAMGAPLLAEWQANGKVRSVAEALQNELRRTQAEAVRRNRQVAFLLTNDSPTKDNPAFTPAVSALNWAIVALPLALSGETANQQPKDAGGNDIPGDPLTGVILNHTQNANSTTMVTADANVLAICFNSVGRLVASAAPIENAGGINCAALPAGTTQRDFQIQRAGANRPLRVQVRVGGQIRMCDPGRSIATQPDGC